WPMHAAARLAPAPFLFDESRRAARATTEAIRFQLGGSSRYQKHSTHRDVGESLHGIDKVRRAACEELQSGATQIDLENTSSASAPPTAKASRSRRKILRSAAGSAGSCGPALEVTSPAWSQAAPARRAPP